MKKSKITEAQIAFILRQAVEGTEQDNLGPSLDMVKFTGTALASKTIGFRSRLKPIFL